ncbi:hypothetical protein P7K49_032723 [Saguinus oedipus]|uniref:WD repeat-containing protein 18 n=1 Tax=Saguinus oedipus TaxID=9490 RepID=A0ABQ9TPX7_SAGOE|nr:hypothetical protein P7K49_032723 [Saguinus oedipus]
MAAPMEVAVCTDSVAPMWSCIVWELHSGANLLTYRGGQAGPRGLALLNGEYLLAAQLGKNYISAWELQRKVRPAVRARCWAGVTRRQRLKSGGWVGGGRLHPESELGWGGEGGGLRLGALRVRESGGFGAKRAVRPLCGRAGPGWGCSGGDGGRGGCRRSLVAIAPARDQLQQKIMCPGPVTCLTTSPNGLYVLAGIAESIHLWEVRGVKPEDSIPQGIWPSLTCRGLAPWDGDSPLSSHSLTVTLLPPFSRSPRDSCESQTSPDAPLRAWIEPCASST